MIEMLTKFCLRSSNLHTIQTIQNVMMMRMMMTRKGAAAHNGAQWRSHCGHCSHWPNFGKRLDGDDYGEDFVDVQ